MRLGIAAGADPVAFIDPVKRLQSTSFIWIGLAFTLTTVRYSFRLGSCQTSPSA